MSAARPSIDVRGYIRAVGTTATELDHGDRSVLAWTGYYVNVGNGETFVSIGTLAIVTGLHPGNVGKHLGRLIAAGYLTTTRRPGKSSVLRLPAGPAEVVHTPRAGARGDSDEIDATPRASARHKESRKSQERLPTVHVVNGFSADDEDFTEDFEVSPDIYQRIGHRLGPNAKPKTKP